LLSIYITNVAFTQIQKYTFEKESYLEEFRKYSKNIIEISDEIDLMKYNEDEVNAVNLQVTERRDSKKGRSLIYKGSETIQEGEIIGIYVGKIIKLKDFPKLESQDYVMQFRSGKKDFFIDAFRQGNMIYYLNQIKMLGNKLRYANHSCNPNCETAEVNWSESLAMALVAIKPINTNEEITFKYKDNVNFECFCESENCRNKISKVCSFLFF
jgi:hypothetical protein